MTYTPESPKPVLEKPGFTLIEDDDVAFSISLCREVHRIYGTYQDGELEATDSVRAGLNLTAQMFAVLQNTVTDGMPAMRLEVGAAQAREMMAALFGEGLPYRRSPQGPPARNRICGRGYRPSFAGRSGHRPAVEETTGPDPAAARELPAGSPTVAPVAPPAAAFSPAQPTAGARSSAVQRSRSRQALRSVFRTLLAVIAICLAAVLIDVPFAVLALFPNHFFPLAVAFLGVGLVAGVGNRIIRTRRTFLI
jgi:hypothetical protein